MHDVPDVISCDLMPDLSHRMFPLLGLHGNDHAFNLPSILRLQNRAVTQPRKISCQIDGGQNQVNAFLPQLFRIDAERGDHPLYLDTGKCFLQACFQNA